MTSDRLGPTPIDRVLEAASADVADLLRRFTQEPLQEGSVLLGKVRAYLEELQQLSEESEFLDLALARRIAAQCESLIASLATGGSEDAHRLVQAAVRYFVEARELTFAPGARRWVRSSGMHLRESSCEDLLFD